MLNKLDILSGLDEIRLCIAYEIDGRRVDAWPSSAEVLGARDADLRGLRGLGRADPRRPLARRPARGGPPLRDRDRGARRRADRARLGRARSGRRRSSGRGGRCAAVRCGHARVTLHHADADRSSSAAGAREHALAWKLADEPGVNEVIVAPGSATRSRSEPRVACVAGRYARRRPRSSRLPAAEAAELVVVGPEAPLAAGVADALGEAGIACLRSDARRGADRERARRSATRSPTRPASGWRRRRVATTPADAAAVDSPSSRSGARGRREGRWPGRRARASTVSTARPST